MTPTRSGRFALLVGGGPAPGINGVISAVTIEAIEQGYEVLGFYDGFQHLVEGYEKLKHPTPDGKPGDYAWLSIDIAKAIALKGGSYLRTARTNPTKSPEMMRGVLDILRRLNVTRLVTIGGDDTAFSGSQVYKHAGGAIRVAHVPKTIDNDLPLPGSTPTFGFETARQVGVGIVRNLAEDARTTSRWYIIVTMGRAAGHLALGIGKAAAATTIIIPEEFRDRQTTLDEVCDIIIGSMIKRKARGSNYGVAVLAEGLIEAIGQDGLREMMSGGRYGEVQTDDHNHLRLGEIDFGRLLKDHLTGRLAELGLKVAMIDKELGYELRSADPIPFDAEYTRDLGYGAVRFLLGEEAARHGAIISFVGGRLEPLPFDEVLDPQTKRLTNRPVNIHGEGYQVARRYMLRLRREDFDDAERLGNLAGAANMTPDEFRLRFGYLVERD